MVIILTIYRVIHPNDMKSEKYIFKKNLSLKRKSKRRLFIESAFMFFLGLFLFYINYLIPNKNSLLQNLPNTLNTLFLLLIDLFLNLYEVFLLIFIFFSWIIALILFLGSVLRILKIFKRK